MAFAASCGRHGKIGGNYHDLNISVDEVDSSDEESVNRLDEEGDTEKPLWLLV